MACCVSASSQYSDTLLLPFRRQTYGYLPRRRALPLPLARIEGRKPSMPEWQPMCNQPFGLCTRERVTHPSTNRARCGVTSYQHSGVVLVQKFVTSGYSDPFNTVHGVLDLSLTRQSSMDDSDMVEDSDSSSGSLVDPLWIVLPLCVAIIAVLLFVVIVIVLRSVYSSRLYFTLPTLGPYGLSICPE